MYTYWTIILVEKDGHILTTITPPSVHHQRQIDPVRWAFGPVPSLAGTRQLCSSFGMRFNGLIFAALVAVSLLLAAFLSAWASESMLSMYIPRWHGGIGGLLRELIVLAGLYPPLIYIVVVSFRSAGRSR